MADWTRAIHAAWPASLMGWPIFAAVTLNPRLEWEGGVEECEHFLGPSAFCNGVCHIECPKKLWIYFYVHLPSLSTRSIDIHFLSAPSSADVIDGDSLGSGRRPSCCAPKISSEWQKEGSRGREWRRRSIVGQCRSTNNEITIPLSPSLSSGNPLPSLLILFQNALLLPHRKEGRERHEAEMQNRSWNLVSLSTTYSSSEIVCWLVHASFFHIRYQFSLPRCL